MERIWQEIRIAARRLARNRGFTVIAVVTLALGLGVNTAIFSLVDAVLLRPLPFADQDRLVTIEETRNGGGRENVSAHEFAAWREARNVFDDLAMYRAIDATLTGDGDAVRLSLLRATANVFTVLGVAPAIGRGFVAGEDSTGAPRVAVLSLGFWRRHFNSDSSVIGRDVLLNQQSYRVVGVAGSMSEFEPDVWITLNVPNEVLTVGRHALTVNARLKPGVTIERASDEVNAISARLERELPQFNTGHRARIITAYEDVVGSSRRAVLVLFGAVGCVLLIACANVAHLMLTRAAGRRREIAICAAVGASRPRLIVQLLGESVLLAVLGGAFGLLIAVWLVALVPTIDAVQIPRIAEATVNGTAIGVAFLLALATGVVSGLVPAIRASRVSLTELLTEGARATGAAGRRIANALVVSELAVAVVLLVGAGLLLKSFSRLTSVDPGFNPHGVLVVPTSLSGPRYATPVAQRDVYDAIARRLAALPGVVAVGGTTETPLAECCNGIALAIEGQPPPPPGQEPSAMLRTTTGDYFAALRIPVRAGRAFNASDARVALPLIRWWDQQPYPPRFDEPQAAPAAVINQAMARAYWPNGDALGKRFRVIASPWITVVGIIGDVKHRSLGADVAPEIYLPASQEPSTAISMMVRFTGDAAALSQAARSVLGEIDRDIAAGAIRTMEDVTHASVASPRFNALALGAFASLAVALAIIGIYGVMSHTVAQRTREIGIRTALGASGGDVMRIVLRQAGALTAAGVALGLFTALGVTRALTRLLYDVAPTDAATYATIAVLLAAVAMLASYVPARRALRVDPLIALRSD
jgi:putative ABC transport system permease protein